MKKPNSEYDENPSELDAEAEAWGDGASLKEKSLIERYKRLEQLMKKKKIMSHIKNHHLDAVVEESNLFYE